MPAPRIEHVNVTVVDPERPAALIQALFEGASAGAARRRMRVHDPCRYQPALRGAPRHDGPSPAAAMLPKDRPLNHVGVAVDDLDATEARVVATGLEPFGHARYEPGRRFYFRDPDGIACEVVSDASVQTLLHANDPLAPAPRRRERPVAPIVGPARRRRRGDTHT